jgi:hypothetical protein
VNSDKQGRSSSEDREIRIIRSICRGVINRVCQENPGVECVELFVRLHAAKPFPPSEPLLDAIWEDEVMAAVRSTIEPPSNAVH